MTPLFWMLSIAALVLLAALAVVTYPFFFEEVEPYRLAESPEDAFSERDTLLEALSDLELAHGAGKLSPADYQTEKALLENRYIEVVEETARKAR
ncbi:MAG: hypothetical protein IIC64_04140 [SAR324 cluster bacterium]|nr:hypothetical protein [SAR324 cluster bacterium]